MQRSIELDVPGKVVVINSSPSEHSTMAHGETLRAHKADELDVAHKYVELAVQDAFRKARRRLQVTFAGKPAR